MIALEYLGHRRSGRGPTGALVQYQVYVAWLPPERDLLTSLVHLAADGFPCPECGHPWPLARAGGGIWTLAAYPGGQIVKTSDSCPRCPTILHFDRTAQARQTVLRWPGLYDHQAAVMGDRPDRIGSRFVSVAGSA